MVGLALQGVRYDSGVESGSEVTMYYDPMICKIIAHGANRHEALQKMDAALRHLLVFGSNLITNHYFLLQARPLFSFLHSSPLLSTPLHSSPFSSPLLSSPNE